MDDRIRKSSVRAGVKTSHSTPQASRILTQRFFTFPFAFSVSSASSESNHFPLVFDAGATAVVAPRKTTRGRGRASGCQSATGRAGTAGPFVSTSNPTAFVAERHSMVVSGAAQWVWRDCRPSALALRPRTSANESGQSAQFSTIRSGTRPKSATFRVTTVALLTSAIAAIRRSLARTPNFRVRNRSKRSIASSVFRE